VWCIFHYYALQSFWKLKEKQAMDNKTAIQWLDEQIEQYQLTFGPIPPHKLKLLVNQAIEIEKTQHEKTWDAAVVEYRMKESSFDHMDFKTWFQTKYKK
jgi:hypothetical protein